MRTGFHFLVVDDLPTVRWLLTALLREIGYTNVSAAEDGEQALRYLQSVRAGSMPVNFIVTDWNMPVMNGMALLRTIRTTAELAHLPVLMVTTEADESSMAAAVRAGADGYLIKPLLTKATLKGTVDSILRERGLMA